mmetsp:Transcript_3594/g.4979  ORF Transcript_3594/g.4979 Transcript_3594/m.4979 type:complete len:113 (-) Transcript_3594:47-385(-)
MTKYFLVLDESFLSCGDVKNVIPTSPVIIMPIPQKVYGIERTFSPKINKPQQKLIKTQIPDQVPTLIASPAFRIPKIPAVPPVTQSNPDNNPQGEKTKFSPMTWFRQKWIKK